MSQIVPIHPRDFLNKHGWTIEQLAEEADIPLDTLKNWLVRKGTAKYREPKPYLLRYFGEIDNRISQKV